MHTNNVHQHTHTHTQLLVREPYGVVQSFSKGLQPTLQELGYVVSRVNGYALIGLAEGCGWCSNTALCCMLL